MKKIFSIVLLAIMLHSCNKPQGCGTVVGFSENNGYYYLHVDFYGEVEKVNVDCALWIKAQDGDEVCF